MYRRPKPPICLSAEQTTQQRDQGGADQGDTAAGHQLLHTLALLMCDKEAIEV